MKDKQLPDVRFGIHKDGWKRIKAKEIFISISDKNHPTLPVLSASQERGMVFRDQIGIDIKYEKDSVKGYKRVKPGQFVIHLRSFQGGFAYSSVEGITSPAYTIIDFKNPEEHDDLFWKIIFSSRNFIKSLEAVTYGIRDGRSISFNDFGTLSMHVPSREEQTKIGSFFKNLDDTISLHQQELEALNQTKQGFLQKMFPKDGETVPVIRFDGFIDDWVKTYFYDNIKNVVDFRGRTPKKLGLEWSKEGYLALSALNVKNGYIDYSADASYGNKELYQKWMSGNELKVGQVLFTTEAPMGNVAQVPDNKGYILSQRTIAFEVRTEKITDDFLSVLLSSPTVRNNLSALASGGTAKGVSQKSLSKLQVVIPNSIKEQAIIATFFKQLNEVIELKEKEIEVLKETRKGFLQKMFV